MARRHPNEYMKTGFRNSGRIAGDGILSDDYKEGSFPSGHNHIYENARYGTGAYDSKREQAQKEHFDNTPIKVYRVQPSINRPSGAKCSKCIHSRPLQKEGLCACHKEGKSIHVRKEGFCKDYKGG